ncbi:hypothetical protein SAMN02800694_2772 [Luteibacter sp. UNCMF331Sha3.1]|uniref:hypothetical protein n=1 Tax=Luteibacter sp. UNCMF331Sha3.1 TaxID=1502760 RepID=UPI0008CEE829|nr:hypothetical protein [Luteibacter sp. UNCMF331Sha3.1]SEN10083.1 hypothetical protein SAMN02800694_2772 [Luteibacter sp. UNCMF331Sha3.1]
MSINTVLAAALGLNSADRAALIRALRAVDAGLDLAPGSVASSTPEEVRALCGTAASTEFRITQRHIDIINEAAARVAAMAGTDKSTRL